MLLAKEIFAQPPRYYFTHVIESYIFHHDSLTYLHTQDLDNVALVQLQPHEFVLLT